VAKWFNNNIPKIIENALDVEYALTTISNLGLKDKLLKIGNISEISSVAWWMNKVPLVSRPLGTPFNQRLPGKTAQDLQLDVVAHETRSYPVYEAITRSHQSLPNVLISRSGTNGEGAIYGDGFYTMKGTHSGHTNTGFTIRFRVNPLAREGSDFLEIPLSDGGFIIVILNRNAIKVIPESLSMSLEDYYQWLGASISVSQDDLGILYRLSLSMRSQFYNPSSTAINYLKNLNLNQLLLIFKKELLFISKQLILKEIKLKIQTDIDNNISQNDVLKNHVLEIIKTFRTFDEETFQTLSEEKLKLKILMREFLNSDLIKHQLMTKFFKASPSLSIINQVLRNTVDPEFHFQMLDYAVALKEAPSVQDSLDFLSLLVPFNTIPDKLKKQWDSQISFFIHKVLDHETALSVTVLNISQLKATISDEIRFEIINYYFPQIKTDSDLVNMFMAMPNSESRAIILLKYPLLIKKIKLTVQNTNKILELLNNSSVRNEILSSFSNQLPRDDDSLFSLLDTVKNKYENLNMELIENIWIESFNNIAKTKPNFTKLSSLVSSVPTPYCYEIFMRSLLASSQSAFDFMMAFMNTSFKVKNLAKYSKDYVKQIEAIDNTIIAEYLYKVSYFKSQEVLPNPFYSTVIQRISSPSTFVIFFDFFITHKSDPRADPELLASPVFNYRHPAFGSSTEPELLMVLEYRWYLILNAKKIIYSPFVANPHSFRQFLINFMTPHYLMRMGIDQNKELLKQVYLLYSLQGIKSIISHLKTYQIPREELLNNYNQLVNIYKELPNSPYQKELKNISKLLDKKFSDVVALVKRSSGNSRLQSLWFKMGITQSQESLVSSLTLDINKALIDINVLIAVNPVLANRLSYLNDRFLKCDQLF
jgi:hypothetical protein